MNAPLRRLSAIAGTTFTELVRLRVFYVLVLFALVLIVSSSFLARISFQQELQVTKDIALGAVSFFLCLLAIAGGAQLLPRDVDDRVVYSVLAKPVPRFEYLLGKFLGLLALLIVSVTVMSALCLAVISLREQTALRETAQQYAQMPASERAVALQQIREAGVNTNLGIALLLIFAKGTILAALTLCVSTFATSTIFTLSSMAMIYLVGHLEAIGRDYWLQQHAAGTLTRVLIAILASVFPDLQAFNVSDQIIAAGSLPSALIWKLIELAAIYTFAYLSLAIAFFYQREL